jgi:hypothetical protein
VRKLTALAITLLTISTSVSFLGEPKAAQATSLLRAPFVPTADVPAATSKLADDFVRLALEIDTHDPGYVDAYFGPAELRKAAEASPRMRAQLIVEAQKMLRRITHLSQSLPIDVMSEKELRALIRNARPVRPKPPTEYDIQRQRLTAMEGMLKAAVMRLQMREGMNFTFSAEAKSLFATQPELKPLTGFDAQLARLDKLLPGIEPLAERVEAFNDRFIIPTDRLKPVFDAAIAECRKRTVRFIKLPVGESFALEFVKDKSWSGYNWYQGSYKSLIQVNTDLPIRISRAVDLGCHEGYPGHHVLNLMVEQKLVRERGWKEYEVNPLYSPQSVISEGSANYGIDLAFSPRERIAFEKAILYPLAGLDPKLAETYWQVQAMTDALSGARLTIAKQYLDGEIDKATALDLIQKYQLLSPARAEQSLRFTDQYRSYVLNYGWGKQLVKQHIEAGRPSLAERWRRMEALLSAPVQPEGLRR